MRHPSVWNAVMEFVSLCDIQALRRCGAGFRRVPVPWSSVCGDLTPADRTLEKAYKRAMEDSRDVVTLVRDRAGVCRSTDGATVYTDPGTQAGTRKRKRAWHAEPPSKTGRHTRVYVYRRNRAVDCFDCSTWRRSIPHLVWHL